MSLRERDKKGYPQFVGRIIEWKNSDWMDGKIECVRVAGFDYHIGFTFVNVNDNADNFACYNGPMSPNGLTKSCDYDKAFEYALKTLRTNSLYDVDAIKKVSGYIGSGFFGLMSDCAFGA